MLLGVFENVEPRAIVATLETSDEGQAFLRELWRYLDEFGWRGDGMYEVGDVTWREQPLVPLNTIQGYLRLSEDTSPDLVLRRARQRREALADQARARLANEPKKLRRFEELLHASRYTLRLTEDHSYWIDQMGVAAFRRYLLSVGARQHLHLPQMPSRQRYARRASAREPRPAQQRTPQQCIQFRVMNCPGFDGDSYPLRTRSSWQHRIVPSSAVTQPRCVSVRCAWSTRRSPRVESASAPSRESHANWGFGPESVRNWVKQAEIDSGKRPGITTAEQKRIAELEREVRELRRANEILKAASAFFAAELDPRLPKKG
jgi:transposase